MTTDEIKSLPLEQKIWMMELLWEDLRDQFERSEISEQQKRILDERRGRVQRGQAQLLDWDSAKLSIGRS
jgi:hypothetical protein